MVWPQGTKSSAALGFGFELLNSGEGFRAIMALLLENIIALECYLLIDFGIIAYTY